MRKALLLILFALITTFSSGQSRAAIDSLKNLFQNSRQDTIRALALRDLSVEFRTIHPDSSLFFGQQALDLSEQINFPKGIARAYTSLSFVYYQTADLAKAWETASQALRVANENNLPLEQSLAYNMMGIVYGNIGDEEKRIDFYRKALKVIARSPVNKRRSEGEAALNNNIGNYFQNNHQIDSALFYYRKSLEIIKPSADDLQSLRVLANLGRTKVLSGQTESGLADIHTALRQATDNQLFDIAVLAHRHLGESFADLKQLDSAVLHFKIGMSMARSAKLPFAIHLIAKDLVTLYDTIDVKKAFYYQSLADSTNEEVRGTKKTAKMISTLLEDLDRQNNERLDREAAQARFRQLVFMGALLVLLIVIWILFRFNQKEKKAKLLLEVKNKEIQAAQTQLIQSEKMASLGELTAGIAHEIQNPLNFVNNFSEVNTELIDELEEEVKKGNLKEIAALTKDIKDNEQKINHHGKRAGDIVKGMLQHSRISSGQKELTDINGLCDEYLRLAYHGLKAKDKSFNAKFETTLDATLPKIKVIPQDIGRVILNLINNAFYAVSEKQKSERSVYEPTVTVRTKMLGDKPDGYRVEICVIDNGNGIPEKIKDKIFQPFFTTKPTGQGTGLGLSLSYDIVKAHGGELKVETKEGVGSEFSIVLPLA